nr:PREDICTED: zinc finger CCHC domain-containing protein 3-like [Latimeria chalumnae]|eukprot:XP_014343665.1 PREDICTED: zinc finger CCHC domain-containing protein 3-like [Latimeria chalumnae]
MLTDSGGLPPGQVVPADSPAVAGKEWGNEMEKEADDFEGIEILEWTSSNSAPEETLKKTKEVEEEIASTSKGLNSDFTEKSPKKSLYSEILKGKKNEERRERSNFSRLDCKRKSVVRLHYMGEVIPDRDMVGRDLIIDSLHVFAFIHISRSRHFDVSFRNMAYLDLFWTRYSAVKNDSIWKDFEVIKVSENMSRHITILFKSELVPASDISFWLKRHCKEVGGLKPIRDRNGFWIGGYKIVVKLYSSDTSLIHLPNFITIGGDQGYLFYPGQPKVCHKCGSGRYFGADCNKLFCSKCGHMGHLAKDYE